MAGMRLLTPAQIAERLQVSVAWVRNSSGSPINSTSPNWMPDGCPVNTDPEKSLICMSSISPCACPR